MIQDKTHLLADLDKPLRQIARAVIRDDDQTIEHQWRDIRQQILVLASMAEQAREERKRADKEERARWRQDRNRST